MKTVILCKIKKGKDVRYVWLDVKLANFGSKLKITKKDGTVEYGWYVIRVRKNRMTVKEDTQEGERQLELLS